MKDDEGGKFEDGKGGAENVDVDVERGILYERGNAAVLEDKVWRLASGNMRSASSLRFFQLFFIFFNLGVTHSLIHADIDRHTRRRRHVVRFDFSEGEILIVEMLDN